MSRHLMMIAVALGLVACAAKPDAAAPQIESGNASGASIKAPNKIGIGNAKATAVESPAKDVAAPRLSDERAIDLIVQKLENSSWSKNGKVALPPETRREILILLRTNRALDPNAVRPPLARQVRGR